MTTDAGANDPDMNLFLLRRVLVGDDDDIPAFAARVSGLTALLAKAKPPMLSARRSPEGRM